MDLINVSISKKNEPKIAVPPIPPQIVGFWDTFDYSWTKGTVPLMIFAYSNTQFDGTGGFPNNQEIISRFPIAVVHQGTLPAGQTYPSYIPVQWAYYNNIRALNPSIKILAYQITNSEHRISNAALNVGNSILNAVTEPTAFYKQFPQSTT